jgi:MFS family permease
MSLPETRSSRHRLLTAARVLWVVYAVSLLVLYLASLPVFVERVLAGTVADILFDVAWPRGNAYFVARAAVAGVSLQQHLVANIGLSLLIIAVHFTVAALIFWRLPDSGFGLLSAWVILLTGSSAMEDAIQVAGLGKSLGTVMLLFFNFGALVWPIFPIWLYLFPDGRAVPRWARWPIGIAMSVFMILMMAAILDGAGLLPPEVWQYVMGLDAVASLGIVLVLPGLLVALGSQIYRYFRVSGPVERQQTKWFLFGLGLFVLLFPFSDVPVIQRLEALNGSLTLTIIPITIAIALLRYRLWDVDVVIRRTAGYAILTGLLLLIYFGSIVILQRLLAPLTGDSTLATILSTLLIAALFLPLRRRVQEAIDRRFFRRKYDAARVLEGFAATARDETDLDKLTVELLRVIQETMQPEHVTIWLRDTKYEFRDTTAEG